MNGRLSLARGWTEPGLQTLWLFLIGGLLVSKDYSRYVGKLWHDQDDLMTGAFPAGGAMAPRGRRSRCGYATGTVAIRPEPVLHPNQIGRASCRDGGCKYGSYPGAAVQSIKNKKKQ